MVFVSLFTESRGSNIFLFQKCFFSFVILQVELESEWKAHDLIMIWNSYIFILQY